MTKSEKEYAAALEPGPSHAEHVQALDAAEAEAGKARLADRVAGFSRRSNKRGGVGPDTSL